jgi:hypothetical protein
VTRDQVAGLSACVPLPEIIAFTHPAFEPATTLFGCTHDRAAGSATIVEAEEATSDIRLFPLLGLPVLQLQRAPYCVDRRHHLLVPLAYEL